MESVRLGRPEARTMATASATASETDSPLPLGATENANNTLSTLAAVARKRFHIHNNCIVSCGDARHNPEARPLPPGKTDRSAPNVRSVPRGCCEGAVRGGRRALATVDEAREAPAPTERGGGEQDELRTPFTIGRILRCVPGRAHTGRGRRQETVHRL
ncbi:hypothetical protein JCM9957A_47060 [Kineosporia succinea]